MTHEEQVSYGVAFRHENRYLYEDAAWVGNTGLIAIRDADTNKWFYIAGEGEVLPASAHDYGSQTHYNFEGQATIIPLPTIDASSMGKIQASKLRSLRKSIKFGAVIPPIDVEINKNSDFFRVVNGGNRIAISVELGFTDIPAYIYP
ncbi:hypothetical protein ACFYPT_41350 [Streptomyces sp. NPDC005529]|uniref:hypothetical protein n=1 Tax=unclassified Streptomyces TaxID=2593676 RepID=UPI0033A272FA